ncbi:MAG: Oxidoreductase FAD-binding region [Proteobacteria bacterium]|nr:Oxidoreductase FAD-binding region [Pseudomonadota bacterium]
MKRTALPLSLLIVILWAALQPAEILSFAAPFLAMRKALTSLTGALALGWMGICMVLALRPSWLERALGGLDQLFYVHKWVGIGAVLLVVAHWLLILSPRTLMAWGWVETVARRPHGPRGGGQSLVGLAKEMGEWSAWLMIALGIVALLRFVPYGWFRKLHKGFPVAFLIGAFHSAVMVQKDVSGTPFGILMLIIALLGSVIAVHSLIGMIGRQHQHRGQVASVSSSAAGVIELQVAPGADWPGHQAGQFALLTLDHQEGAHPFTIVSDWRPGANLRFAIKPLGDYTRTLATHVKAGDAATVEGPYGRFDFGDASDPQVWVAGGIGVAPFMARLEALASSANQQQRHIHFFYSVHSVEEASFPQGLEALCQRAGVTLHLRVTPRDGRISDDDIGQFAQQSRGVWFCGPAAWARSLRDSLRRDFGLLPQQFHRELFEFR